MTMITCNLHSYFCVISDIAEEGDDAFAAMRRAKAKSSLKGKGKKFVEVPREVELLEQLHRTCKAISIGKPIPVTGLGHVPVNQPGSALLLYGDLFGAFLVRPIKFR